MNMLFFYWRWKKDKEVTPDVGKLPVYQIDDRHLRLTVSYFTQTPTLCLFVCLIPDGYFCVRDIQLLLPVLALSLALLTH